tara:strand:- start:890 stop:1237 length:348 start_codon:yes stop_codon:yes gene_type:complete
MKNLLKQIIKLVFVIILPILTTISVVYLLRDGSTFNGGVIDWVLPIITLIMIYLNAFFYLVFMGTTKMSYLLPDVSFEFIPGIGFYLGTDKHPCKFVILLPFLSIQVSKNKKKPF